VDAGAGDARRGAAACRRLRGAAYKTLYGSGTFYDCEEGDTSHDYLFNKPKRVFMAHGRINAYRAQATLCRSGKARATSSTAPATLLGAGSRSIFEEPWERGDGDGALLVGDFRGLTIPEWLGPGLRPPRARGVMWSRCDGSGFRVRVGPGYDGVKKADSAPGSCLYECVSVDIVRSQCKISGVLNRLIAVPPADGTAWAPECQLPRILCMNVQIPLKTGSPLRKHPSSDHGVSIVAVFRVRGETLEMLRRGGALEPCVRLFRDFVRGGRTDLPCAKSATKTTGLLKGIAFAENVGEVNVPWLLKPLVQKYNAKPCLITKSGSVAAGERGEWLEIGVDVRRFSSAAKTSLVQLRDCLPQASIHVGILIQGQEDEDLPEGLVMDVRLHYLNLLNARWINDPCAAGGSGRSASHGVESEASSPLENSPRSP